MMKKKSVAALFTAACLAAGSLAGCSGTSSTASSEAADNTNNSISPIFLLQAGEILESQGKKSEALQIYQDIKTKYLNSAVSQDIDKYIERVSVK